MTDSPNGGTPCPFNSFSFRVFGVVRGLNCGFQVTLHFARSNPTVIARCHRAHTASLETAEHRRDFTDYATKACTLPLEAPIKIGGALLGSEDFNDQGLLRKEPSAVGMAFVQPVSQKPGAHRRLPPEQPAVLKAGNIIVAGIGTPDLGVLPVLIGFAHAAINLTTPRAASSPRAPGRAAHSSFVWAPATPAATALRR